MNQLTVILLGAFDAYMWLLHIPMLLWGSP